MAEELSTTEKPKEIQISVTYSPGRWGKVFHIFDLDSSMGVKGDMSSQQLAIPGLELSPELIKKPKAGTLNRITDLETRVAHLELEVTLLKIQLGR